MFKDNSIWVELQNYLPQNNRITDEIQPEEKTIEYRNSTIRFDEYVPKNKDADITIVIFHGVGGNGRLLSFIAVPLLRAGFKVICPDLPGYGYTVIKESFDYSTWIDYGSFIVKQELNKKNKVYIFGLSAGGMLAYNVACQVGKINGLIVTNLLDNRYQEVRDYSAKNRFHARVGVKILNKLPASITKMKIPVKSVANMKAIVNNKEVLKLLLKDKVGSGSSVSISFLLSMMNSIPIIEPEKFDICPVLMVHPDQDKWTPTHISRLFFDKIKANKELVMLENAGHFPLEEPGIRQLEEAVISFIKNTNNGY